MISVLLAACGSGQERHAAAPASTTAAPGATEPTRTGLAAAQEGLRAEIARLTWPPAYTPTVKTLTPKLGDPKQILLTRDLGRSLAHIWNLCAWADEAADRVEAGASPADLDLVATKITTWASSTRDPWDVSGMVEGIRTGDLTGTNAFIEANGCRPFPS